MLTRFPALGLSKNRKTQWSFYIHACRIRCRAFDIVIALCGVRVKRPKVVGIVAASRSNFPGYFFLSSLWFFFSSSRNVSTRNKIRPRPAAVGRLPNVRSPRGFFSPVRINAQTKRLFLLCVRHLYERN